MAISKEDAIKELQNRDMVYVAYSQIYQASICEMR